MSSSYFVHPSAVIDPEVQIGEGTKIWHFSHILPGTILGKNCNLGQNVVVGPNVQVGEGVKIQNNCFLCPGVQCEDYVFIGPSVVFTNILNPRSAIARRHEFKPTLLKKGASLGANSTIVCGVELGEYSMVGAGSVITKNVPAYALMVGNPARQKGWVSEYGHKLCFSKDGFATCPESGQKYELRNNRVSLVK